MAEIINAAVSEGRITFSEGTEKKDVKAHCGDCRLDVVCHGFDSKGFAVVEKPRGISWGKDFIKYIEDNASCLNQK